MSLPALAQNAGKPPTESSTPTIPKKRPVTSAASSSKQAVEDIVVTANRRSERSQRVGVSLTALSGATLAAHNIQSSEDLQQLVPGLNASTATGSGVATFVVRGVGESDFSDHEEQPNAPYIDGVYVPFATAASIPLFDQQRVEVLRGPQGTLFGRNATGGLIQYISNAPTPGFSGGIEAATGSRNLYRVQGFLDDGNDTIANRFSYYFESQDGFIENALGPNRGNREVFAYRDQLQYTPNADTKITVRLSGFNQAGTAVGYVSYPSYTNAQGVDALVPPNLNVYGTCNGCDPYGYRNPYGGRLKVALNDPGAENKNSEIGSITAVEKLGDDSTLTSTSAGGAVHSIYREDTDSTPLNVFGAGVASRAYDFQQDLHINGSVGRFRYTGGLFFLYIDGKYSLYNDYPRSFSNTPDPGQELFNKYGVLTRSEAAYTQGEYDITDQLTFIAGARYTWDQLRINFVDGCYSGEAGHCPPGQLVGQPITGAFPIYYQTLVTNLGPLKQNYSDADWSGKLELNYKPLQDALLYLTFAKGFKSGGFTAPLANLSLPSLAFRPEKLYDIEGGEKLSLLGNRLFLNTGAYLYDYLNNQNFLFQGENAIVLNLPSHAYGYEVEVNARPLPDVTAYFNAAYNHFLISDVPFAPGNEPQRPNLAPRIAFNWGLGKSFDLGGDYRLNLDYSGRYVGQIYYNLINSPLDRAPPYVIHNFDMRLETPYKWYASIHINNAFDRQYQIGAFDVTGFGFALKQYGEPLTVTGAIGTRF